MSIWSASLSVKGASKFMSLFSPTFSGALVNAIVLTRVLNSNCFVGHMRTYKATRGPHYDANATIAVPELNFTSYFLRKVSWIIGNHF